MGFRGLILCLLVFALPSQAHAFRFAIWGLYDISSPKVTAFDTTISSSSSTGYGLSVGVPLEQGVDLETGLLMLPRKFTQSQSLYTFTQDVQATFVQIPVLLRFWMNRYVSFVGGIYYAKGIGNVTVTDQWTGTPFTSQGSFSDFGLKRDDVGFIGGLGVDIPAGQNVGVVIDARYVYGTSDAADVTSLSISSWKNRDYQILFGLRLGERDFR